MHVAPAVSNPVAVYIGSNTAPLLTPDSVRFPLAWRASSLLGRSTGMVYPHIRRARLWQSLTLVGCAAATFAIGDRPSSAQTAEPRVVPIVARRFAFEPSQIEATVGERLQLVITSADGVHGVEIKKLKIKKEVPRGGEAVTIDFTATTEGSFPILCSEYCGNGHTDMTGMLIVRSASGAGR